MTLVSYPLSPLTSITDPGQFDVTPVDAKHRCVRRSPPSQSVSIVHAVGNTSRPGLRYQKEQWLTRRGH